MQPELSTKNTENPNCNQEAFIPRECAEVIGKDSTKIHLTHFIAMFKRQLSLSPNGKALYNKYHSLASSSPGHRKILSEKATLQSWTNGRSIPNDSFQEHNYCCKNSMGDNSQVFPSPPKLSEGAFGETNCKTFAST